MNLPNLITLLRIGLIPVFIVVFFVSKPWANEAMTILFAVGALTDWLDGYLARRLHQTSPLGAFLDPVADKLMVSTVLVLLVQADPRAAVALPAIVIIGREIAVSALRELMAELGQRATVAVAMVGKVKTTVQMSAIILMLYRDPVAGVPVYDIGLLMLYAATVLTLWSMIVYLKAAWPAIKPAAEPHDD